MKNHWYDGPVVLTAAVSRNEELNVSSLPLNEWTLVMCVCSFGIVARQGVFERSHLWVIMKARGFAEIQEGVGSTGYVVFRHLLLREKQRMKRWGYNLRDHEGLVTQNPQKRRKGQSSGFIRLASWRRGAESGP